MTSDRPTMEDVAARAGVSRALVSIVFRHAPGAASSTRERVLHAAAELGYEPDRRASRLGRSRTHMIGVVFGLGLDFHAEVVDGIYAVAELDGYEVVLSGVTARRREDSAVRALLAERCEAVILIGTQLRPPEVVELAGRVPTVVLLRNLRTRTVDVVRTDERTGMEQLVDHLSGLGHERILHLDGGSEPGAAQRREGYRAAMAGRGLRPQVAPGGGTEEAGVSAADVLLERPRDERPSAVAAFNDRCALGVLHRMHRSGVSVPERLSVTGFDDIGAAGYGHIELTTVRQDADRLGQVALDRVRRRLEETREPSLPFLVPPSLVVRRTTAAPA